MTEETQATTKKSPAKKPSKKKTKVKKKKKSSTASSPVPKKKVPAKKKSSLLKAADEFEGFLRDLGAVTVPESIRESAGGSQEAKKLQLQNLASRFVQSRLMRSLEIEDVRHKLVQDLVGKLDDASPTMLLRVINALSEIGQAEVSALLGQNGGGRGGRGDPQQSVLNLNISTGGPAEGAPAISDADGNKILRSLAVIHQELRSGERVIDIESKSVKVEK